ncbi:MAG: Stk1 family PASTA domain-containing Ser/Thr kinase [Bacillota bacterium]|nr:Stk1 family PASTA domain-containing Ser/Thr kinase [Bacillota bacterium]
MAEIILGDRYEIQNEIGAGGMAIVYKAHDKVLNRDVAVKVLRPEYKQDQDFIKRFDIEAKAAASLNHPNIVGIHDVGVHDGLHYIVMEYIEGKTLKEYISEKGKLDWRETLKVSMQICAALEHAHEHKIIHRDIKPHNIMVNAAGVVKVTDFGIARATSASTTTIGTTVLGSAHYLSPEQARGGFTDERSDIYSLGVCMYEMITGTVPFDADNTVAVAMQHLQKEPTPVSEIIPDIPNSVEFIIMKAMRKEQRARYLGAKDMYADMLKVSINPDAELTDDNNADEVVFSTKQIPVIKPEDERAYAAKENQTAPKDLSEKKDKKEDKKEDKEKKPEDKRAVIAAITVAFVIIAAAVFMLRGALFGIDTGKKSVPNLKGLTVDQAQEVVSELDKNIELVETDEYSAEEEKDKIISQDPAANENVPGSKMIYITVGKGEKTTKLEDYTGMNADEAQKKLTKLGYKCTIAEENNENLNTEYKKDTVTRQIPEAGSKAKAGDTVTLYKSKGVEETVKVPDLKGYSLDAAKALLKESNLICGDVKEVDSDKPENTVVGQSIPADTKVEVKQKINLEVSKTKTETGTNTNTETGKSISFQLPSQPDQMTVKVIRKDNGATVYQKVHNASETVTVNFKFSGDVTLEIYVNDQFYKEESVNG